MISMLKITNRGKIILITLVIVGALSFLLINSFQESAAYYTTVEELLKEEPSPDTYLRLAGILNPESIKWNEENNSLLFSLEEPGYDIHVNCQYNNIKPDNFADNDSLLLEGYYRNNVFLAEKIMYQCPSRYEEELKSN